MSKPKGILNKPTVRDKLQMKKKIFGWNDKPLFM